MSDGAGRGVVLVVVAVVVGFVLLAAGLDDSSVTVRTNAQDEAQDNVDTGGDDAPDTTDTVVPTNLDPSAIPVIVANGSGVSGAAGAVSEQLIALGYNPGSPTDATSEVAFDTVYFNEGSQGAAEKVASDLGLGPEAVLAMPSPPPADQAAIGLAQVLVVLGSTPGGLAESASATTTPAG